MFNYPSGSGIHIGHAMNYTISDVMARFKRQQGFESYHPIGWDSFGLPAENYAIKAGISPQSMANIIPDYTNNTAQWAGATTGQKRLRRIPRSTTNGRSGFFLKCSVRVLPTKTPVSNGSVKNAKTSLANEQITAEGKCWRHESADDAVVGKKEIKQWFFKITDYADELLEATDALDWTESVKLAQKNWIGKSKALRSA